MRVPVVHRRLVRTWGMSVVRTYRAGASIEDFCRVCKMDRVHTVVAASPAGDPLRVVCGYCRSEHNYRGGPRNELPTPASPGPEPPMSSPAGRQESRDTCRTPPPREA